ncbi:hypothetical protein CY35_08G134100 [Sphagnum magellanicum]|nr:hypothetical protein CY35_08G134100 [Sphagnum magellanicum]
MLLRSLTLVILKSGSCRDSASIACDEDIENDRQRHSESQVNQQHLHQPFSAREFSLLLN